MYVVAIVLASVFGDILSVASLLDSLSVALLSSCAKSQLSILYHHLFFCFFDAAAGDTHRCHFFLARGGGLPLVPFPLGIVNSKSKRFS